MTLRKKKKPPFAFCRVCRGRGMVKSGEQKKGTVDIHYDLIPGVRYGQKQAVFLVFIEGRNGKHIVRKRDIIVRAINRLRTYHREWR